jgi:seryl-tRNA synthetase
MCACELAIHRNRIKYYCEADEAFLCSQCKKEHKGSQHSVRDFKVEGKKFRVEVSNMLKDYHLRVNQLLQAKKNLSDKIKDTDTQLNTEIDRISVSYNQAIEALKQSKNALIDDLKKNIAYKNNKIKDKYTVILKQIDRLKEGWNSLTEFNNQIDNSSYEEFFRFRNLNHKELMQVATIVESCISSLNHHDPFFQQNNEVNVNLGSII